MQQLFSFKKSGLSFQNELRKYFEDKSISLKMKANVINYSIYGYGNDSIFSSIDIISEQATPAYGQILCKTNINQFSKFKITMTDSWNMLNYLGFNSIVNNVIQTLKTYYEAEDGINEIYNKAIRILYKILNDTLMYAKFRVCNYHSANELTFFWYCVRNLYYEHDTLFYLIENIKSEGPMGAIDPSKKPSRDIINDYKTIYDILSIHNSLYTTILPTIEFVYENERNRYVSHNFGHQALSIDEVVRKIHSVIDKEFINENIGKLNSYKGENENEIIKLVYAVSDYSTMYLQNIYNYMRYKIYPFVEIACDYNDPKFIETNRNMIIIPQIKIINNNTDVYIYTNCSICHYYNPKCIIVKGTLKEKMIGYNYDNVKNYIDRNKNNSEYQNAYVFINNRIFKNINLRSIKSYIGINDGNDSSEEDFIRPGRLALHTSGNENEIIDEEQNQNDYDNEMNEPEKLSEKGETDVLREGQSILKSYNIIIQNDGKYVLNENEYVIVSQNDVVLTFNEFDMMRPPIKRNENENELYSFENDN